MVDAPATNPRIRLPPRSAEIVFTTTEPAREASFRRHLEHLVDGHWAAETYLRRRRRRLLNELDRARAMQWVMWLIGLLLGLAIGRPWWP